MKHHDGKVPRKRQRKGSCTSDGGEQGARAPGKQTNIACRLLLTGHPTPSVLKEAGWRTGLKPS